MAREQAIATGIGHSSMGRRLADPLSRPGGCPSDLSDHTPELLQTVGQVGGASSPFDTFPRTTL